MSLDARFEVCLGKVGLQDELQHTSATCTRAITQHRRNTALSIRLSQEPLIILMYTITDTDVGVYPAANRTCLGRLLSPVLALVRAHAHTHTHTLRTAQDDTREGNAQEGQEKVAESCETALTACLRMPACVWVCVGGERWKEGRQQAWHQTS